MRIKIFSINPERDSRRMKHQPLAAWDISPVDSSIYDCVYDREYPPVSLEQALLDLLIQSRSSDAGRPGYQVSDVIQIQDSLDQANKAFYVLPSLKPPYIFSPVVHTIPSGISAI